MIEQVFKDNAKHHSQVVLTGAAFAAEVFFPKIRNLNRLHPGHRHLTMAKTEKRARPKVQPRLGRPRPLGIL
jgi:hypothetical protein